MTPKRSDKFTPGPWRVEQDKRWLLIQSKAGTVVSLQLADDLALIRANARLIALAPEMFRMLVDAKATLLYSHERKLQLHVASEIDKLLEKLK